MIDPTSELLASISLQRVLLAVLLFVVTFAVSLAVVSFILVKLPSTYFQEGHPRDFWSDRHPGIRLAGVFAKNVLGILLVALGILMSIPGVPGQGVLTILLGIMLLDFPGKRRLEQKLLSRPGVLKTINRLRLKFDKPPLI